jgi:hypothetical protein
VSFVVTPKAASVVVGGTQQFTAIETFSDATTIDRTAVSTWSAVDIAPGSGVATILGTGVATGASIGQSTITATYGAYTGTVGLANRTAILTVTAPTPGPAGSVDLGTASTYGLIAWDAITNSAGFSHIYGDVALTQMPSGTIANVTGPGFNDGGSAPNLTSSIVTNSANVTPGIVNAADNGNPGVLTQLWNDLNVAYLDLMTRAAPATALTTPALALGQNGGTFPPGQDLSGYRLSPGIFTTSGTYALSHINGPLVLDAGGNPDAVFIIRSTSGASGFTSTTGSVILQNGAQAKNVYWVVAHDITIGIGTFFQGTVLAGNTITLLQYVNVEGRMLAGALASGSGALTLTDTNVITVPAP